MQIVFSHGNSFPGATYNVLLDDLRRRGFSVAAVDKFGHAPEYPVTSNWPNLVQQLADFAAPVASQAGEGVFLIGHSLGGFVSLMCAARHARLGGHAVRGVLLIDSPVLGGWRATALGMAKRTQLVGSVSPGAVSRKRKNRWPDEAAVFAHFRHKRAFAKWDEQVLRDYVTHGTVADGATGERVLAFDRDIETLIYNTLPHNLDRLLREHPPKCPVAFIGGRASAEMKQVGMAMTRRITQGRVMMLDGSHLFPMEKPVATAAAIEASLRNMID